MSRKCQSE